MKDNRTLTQLDNAQILRQQYDVENEAQRVVIVAGEVPTVRVDVDASALTSAIQEGLGSLKLNPDNTATKVERIEVPVIIKETVVERIEIPVVTTQIEYREIRIPFEVPKFIEIEKPVVIKETQIQVIKQSTTETKYLRIAVVGLVLMEILTLLLSRH